MVSSTKYADAFSGYEVLNRLVSLFFAAIELCGNLLGNYRFGEGLFLAIFGSIVVAAFVLVPSPDSVSFFGMEIPTVCQFKVVTGYPCPGCGLTRSFCFMARGAFKTAFDANWFGPPMYVFVAAQVPYRIFTLVRGPRPSRRSSSTT